MFARLFTCNLGLVVYALVVPMPREQSVSSDVVDDRTFFAPTATLRTSPRRPGL